MQEKIAKILTERQNDHGDFVDNAKTIGKMWGALLNINDIEPYKVALMMDILKTVRAFNNPRHEDNWLDKIGYTQHGKNSVFWTSD